MFRDGVGARDWVRERICNGEGGTLAVAFWGAGAIEQLGLNRRPTTQSLSIICNLAMGGTNPSEIERLRKLEKVTVTQSNRLHGKVYRFAGDALVGSANASANGLSFEGKCTESWHEATLITSDDAALASIDEWIDRLQPQPIVDDDIKRAKLAWKSRRRASFSSSTLVEDIHSWLSAGKESFSERPVYLVAYSNDALPDHVAEEAKQIHVEYGRKIDYYWDWPGLPKDGILVSFLVSENGEILRLDGLRERRPALSPKSIVDGTSLELCEKRGGGRRAKSSAFGMARSCQLVKEKEVRLVKQYGLE